jgi:hypothetical protein
MTLNVSAEIFIPLVVLAVAFGWYIAWRKMQKIDQELREKTAERDRLREEARTRELQRLVETARGDPDYAFLHQEVPLSALRLTEEQRQQARRVSERLSQDMDRTTRSIDETMRRAFQPFDQAMGSLDREAQRLTGGRQGVSRDGTFTSVTVTTERQVTTQASQAKAKQEAAQKPVPPAEPTNRFDRILRDD